MVAQIHKVRGVVTDRNRNRIPHTKIHKDNPSKGNLSKDLEHSRKAVVEQAPIVQQRLRKAPATVEAAKAAVQEAKARKAAAAAEINRVVGVEREGVPFMHDLRWPGGRFV